MEVEGKEVEEVKIGAEQQKTFSPEDLQPVKSEGVDLTEFDGSRVQIDTLEVTQVKSQFSKTGMQWVLKVQSVPLKEIEVEGEKISFRASELFNLVQDDAGNLKGYPDNEKSNLAKFMKRVGVKAINQLKGRTALI